MAALGLLLSLATASAFNIDTGWEIIVTVVVVVIVIITCDQVSGGAQWTSGHL